MSSIFSRAQSAPFLSFRSSLWALDSLRLRTWASPYHPAAVFRASPSFPSAQKDGFPNRLVEPPTHVPTLAVNYRSPTDKFTRIGYSTLGWGSRFEISTPPSTQSYRPSIYGAADTQPLEAPQSFPKTRCWNPRTLPQIILWVTSEHPLVQRPGWGCLEISKRVGSEWIAPPHQPSIFLSGCFRRRSWICRSWATTCSQSRIKFSEGHTWVRCSKLVRVGLRCRPSGAEPTRWVS